MLLLRVKTYTFIIHLGTIIDTKDYFGYTTIHMDITKNNKDITRLPYNRPILVVLCTTVCRDFGERMSTGEINDENLEINICTRCQVRASVSAVLL